MDPLYFKPGMLQERKPAIHMRLSTKEILEKRSNRTSINILVTGATGFIGSHICVKLLESGYNVFLIIRKNREQTAFERFKAITDWFELDPILFSKLKVFEGELEEPSLNLNSADHDFLSKNVDEIVHCAASTCFTEQKREETEKVNIFGLGNILEFAKQSRCYYFHHMSTAFVAGKTEGVFKEAIVDVDNFNNIYEETKYLGERAVSDFCRRNGIGLNIYRPSIVYGNSETGKNFRFNALYFPVKTILFLKNLYKKDIEKNKGANAQKMGVTKSSEGMIFLPIRIVQSKNGHMNMIPINYCVDAFCAIMEDSVNGGIFHLVTRDPEKLETIIEYIKRMFNIEGIRAVDVDELNKSPKNALEILFDTYIDLYKPYIKDPHIFVDDNAKEILSRHHIQCPPLTYEIFEKCMNYAIDVNWGKKLF